MKKEIYLFAILFAAVLAIATESFAQCSRLGARDWITGEYQFCDGTDWQAFSYDGTAGVCTVPAEIEWDGNEAAYTVCDGSDRQIIRYAASACSLTSAMLDVGASIADAAWEDQISAFTIYDGGTKAIAHGRWTANFLTFDISGAPAAPSVITLSPSVSGRVDSADLVVRNGYVYGVPRGVTDGNTGRANTSILAEFGASAHPVAHYCETLTAHGYDDWYLPSRYELDQIMQNADLIGAFVDEASQWYWSSTEFNDNSAYVNKPTLNVNAYTGKNDNYPRSRCVRKEQ